MTTYAIGSVNGRYRLLLTLLDKLRFDPQHDSLWFAGNLIQEQAQSLDVLRFVKSLGNKAVTVLGGQELRFLALGKAAGSAQPANDTAFADILAAGDRDDWLNWLRRKPLIHHDAKLNFTLVHAGIPAEWSFSQAITFAYEVESALARNGYQALLENWEQEQSRWHAKLRGWKRLSFILNALTLMNYCNHHGKLDFKTKGPVSAQSEELLPWYRLPGRLTAQLNIIFADDAPFCDTSYPGIYPLPSEDCLSALKLAENPQLISVNHIA